jgi:hypothetical protein
MRGLGIAPAAGFFDGKTQVGERSQLVGFQVAEDHAGGGGNGAGTPDQLL